MPEQQSSDREAIAHLDFSCVAPCLGANRSSGECTEGADILLVCKACGGGMPVCLNHYATVMASPRVFTHVCGMTGLMRVILKPRAIGRS
jgi:hypothetical protein